MQRRHLYIAILIVLLIAFLYSFISISSDDETVLSASSFDRLNYSPDWESKKRAKIQAVQQRLQELGYDCGTVDGVWGLSTEQAIKAFQRDRQLAEDGMVGPATRKALNLHR